VIAKSNSLQNSKSKAYFVFRKMGIVVYEELTKT